MSEKNDAKDTRIRDRIMEITKGTRIREKVIKDGKVAVYLKTGSDGEFIVKEDKTGIISKVPYERETETLRETKNHLFDLRYVDRYYMENGKKKLMAILGRRDDN